MKYRILYLVFAVLVLIACGQDTYVEAGVSQSGKLPLHGHSGVIDGGTLKASPYLYASSSAYTLFSSGTKTIMRIDTIVSQTSITYFNTSTFRYQPLIPGLYLIGGSCYFSAGTTATNVEIRVRKNNVQQLQCSVALYGSWGSAEPAFLPLPVCLLYLNGSSDYIELWGMMVGTGALQGQAFLQAMRLSD